MKLSNQAMGAIMFALQNSLANQTDIVPVFESWNLFMKDGQLFVENAPYVELSADVEDEGEEYDGIVDFLTEPDEE